MEQGVIGKVVDSYKITKVLGKGGMGIVYKARDMTLDRDVALKMMDASLAQDESFLKRFQSEAKALAKLQNPNIVSVFALRETELGFCIVMEFVEGNTLADRIKQWGALPLKMVISIFKQMLTALDYAHKAGIIHRDIKPSNIMLTEQNVVKVTDFGLAKIQQVSAATMTIGTGGTLYYMSPEQVRGLANVDLRGDIYSLGMTLYEAVTGKVPFSEGDADFTIRQAIVEGRIPSPEKLGAGIPRELAKVIMKAIDKDPDKRYQSAGEMRDALEKLESVVEARQTPARDMATRIATADVGNTSRRPLVLAGGVVVLVAGAFFLYRYLQPPPAPLVSINTNPSGSVLFVNGDSVGVSPLRGFVLAPGEATISARLTGFKQKDTTLQANGGEVLAVSLTLEKEPLPPAPISTEQEKPVTVPPVKPARTDVAVKTATLVLQAVPGGSVSIDGGGRVENAASPSELQVQSGNQSVTFQHPRYGSKTFRVDLQPEERRRLTCYFVSYVSILSQPVWGSIVIDGKPTDLVTPTDRYQLGPGRHTVTVTRTGYDTMEGVKEIVVEPGTEERVIPLVFNLKKR
jgi:serine/threonine protein kinase